MQSINGTQLKEPHKRTGNLFLVVSLHRTAQDMIEADVTWPERPIPALEVGELMCKKPNAFLFIHCVRGIDVDRRPYAHAGYRIRQLGTVDDVGFLAKKYSKHFFISFGVRMSGSGNNFAIKQLCEKIGVFAVHPVSLVLLMFLVCV